MKDILILIPQNTLLFEAAGIADIFGTANRGFGDSPRRELYRVDFATTEKHPMVHSRSGMDLVVKNRIQDLDLTKAWDTVIVTGKGVGGDEAEEIVACLQALEPNVKRMVSICSGALLFAQAGFLNGRKATTHWRLYQRFLEDFSKVHLVQGPLFAKDDKFWTSAGVSAGFDLTLALIEEDLGFETAREVAQDLVMFLRRPGGQSQFSRFLYNQVIEPGPIREVQGWILENLTQELSVDQLAEKASMSPRHFSRVFTKEVGYSPARFVEESRVEAARLLLEQSGAPVEQIALKVGFGSALKMRRSFLKKLQVSPREYRERFSRGES